MRKSAPKTVKVLLSAGYSTNPSDSVNLRRNSSAERAAASGPLSGSASVSPSALANIDLCQDFGHGSSRIYAAMGSSPAVGLVRSKKASMAFAGIW